MIRAKIPKEIGDYEAKVAGPLTMRQLIIFMMVSPLVLLIYSYATPVLGRNLSGYLLVFPAGIAFLFGWFKPYGMRFEKFVKTAFVSNILSPSKRVYKTENYYDRVNQHIISEQKSLIAKDKSKKIKKGRPSKKGYK